MADKKISQLTAATTPLAGSEVLPIVQSSTTVKVSVADVTKGRTIQTTGINDNNNNEVITITTTASAVNEITVANAATGANPVISATGGDTNIGITLTPKGTGNLVLTSGNLVVASGSGIDFSATSSGTGTMISELLNDYEEGTWTPVFSTTGTGFTSVSYTTQNGFYTKIGNCVFITAQIVVSALTAGSPTGDLVVAGFPFTINATHVSALPVSQAGAYTTNIPSMAQARAANTMARLYYRATANGGLSTMSPSELTSTSTVVLSGFYYV